MPNACPVVTATQIQCVSASRVHPSPKKRLESRVSALPRAAFLCSDLSRCLFVLSSAEELKPLFSFSLRILYDLETFDFTHGCTSSMIMLMKLTTVSNVRTAGSSDLVK